MIFETYLLVRDCTQLSPDTVPGIPQAQGQPGMYEEKENSSYSSSEENKKGAKTSSASVCNKELNQRSLSDGKCILPARLWIYLITLSTEWYGEGLKTQLLALIRQSRLLI